MQRNRYKKTTIFTDYIKQYNPWSCFQERIKDHGKISIAAKDIEQINYTKQLIFLK